MGLVGPPGEEGDEGEKGEEGEDVRRRGWNTASGSTPDRTRCGLFLGTIKHMWRGGRAKRQGKGGLAFSTVRRGAGAVPTSAGAVDACVTGEVAGKVPL